MSSLLNYELIIFDLDGTLIDTAPIVVHLLNKLRLRKGMMPKDNTVFNQAMSMGGAELIAFALELDLEQDRQEIHEALKLFRDEYITITNKKNSVYRGVTKILEMLTDFEVQMCICTNKPRQLALKSLKETDLLDYFNAIVCGDDLNLKKPNPKLITHLSHEFSVTYKQMVLIGDSIIDFHLANNAGIDFIFYTNGYNNSEPILKNQRNFNIYSELMPLLLRKN